ncbi:hypothetical protein TEQG_08473 [Trichophyton equinum CBS 127.97]|uniref:Uncharacterized protein n=1 Tax=Trichophyton equinum (strain ATCC MYA-4606 / CBS 127.97) TaxID=559882 RepID=F2Q5V1_TRIEC|nr:hypothetical protein TEQG_08473 [Trichophyton equinum CBS 127.97]
MAFVVRSNVCIYGEVRAQLILRPLLSLREGKRGRGSPVAKMLLAPRLVTRSEPSHQRVGCWLLAAGNEPAKKRIRKAVLPGLLPHAFAISYESSTQLSSLL